jgi:DNA-binding Lrp family transcriptional regulator
MRFLIKEVEASKKQANLSKRDKKLIQLLIQDGRIPISELAKKLRISRPAITQRIKTLKERNILLEPVTYSNVKINQPMHLIQISTGLGHVKEEITSNLLNLEGVAGLLWYNYQYNLLIVSLHEDVQELVEKIESILDIKKMRILRTINNWFHPPHLFKYIKDKLIPFTNNAPEIDELDSRIINTLHNSPRASILEISQTIGSAPITIKKRIQAMQKSGAITYFSHYVNPWACGKDIVSVHLSIKGRKNINKIVSKLLSYPQTGNVWEFDHEWNLNVIFWVSDQTEVNKILEELGRHNEILDSEVMVLASMVGK